MIQASHHPFYTWFFRHYSRLMIKWHFREVCCQGDLSAPEGPLLVVANHFSWWDGFIINHLNHRFWHKRFHVMMLEEQLSKRSFLSKSGAFSVSREGKDSFRSLRYAMGRLKHDENMLLLFPQGRFTSQASSSLQFEEGAGFLVDKSGAAVKLVVLLVDYFSHRKPFLSCYVKNLREMDPSISLEQNYNRFYKQCIEQQNKKALI